MKKLLILGIFLISSLPVRGVNPAVEENSSVRWVATKPHPTLSAEGSHDPLLVLGQILAYNPSSIIILVFPSPVSNPKNSLTPPPIEETTPVPLEEQLNGKAITEKKEPLVLPPPLVTAEQLLPPPPPPLRSPRLSKTPPVKEASKQTGTSKLLADIQAGKSLKPAEERVSPQRASPSTEARTELLAEIQRGKALKSPQARVSSPKVTSSPAANVENMSNALEKRILARRDSISDDREEEGEEEEEWK